MDAVSRSFRVSLTAVAALGLATVAGAQYATVDWANTSGSTGNEYANGVAIDGTGNVYVTGQFTNTVDFDPGAGTANLTSAGNTDAFVAKYDSAGVYLWAFAIGGTGYDYGYAIAVDGSGNVYVAGQFALTVDFDPGAGSTTRTASGADAFVAAYTTGGAFSWVQSVGGTSNDRGRAVAVGSGVYVAGEFMGSNVDFDPGAGSDLHSSAGSQDVFLWKLAAADGAFSWARTVGGSGSDVAYGVALNSATTQAYVVGQFNGTVDFDPGVGTSNQASAGGTDAFVWNVDSTGAYGWAVRVGSTTADVANAVAVDASGNIVATGYFNGTVDFDPGVGTSDLISAGGTDVFVLKLSSAGAFTWVGQVGGTGADIGSGIGLDGSGNVFVAGLFAATVCEPAITSAGQSDALLAKWLADGTRVSLNGMGGTDFDDGRAIAVSGGNVAVAGSFQLTADLDPGIGVLNRTSAGGRDLFVARYSALPTTAPVAPEIAVLQGAVPITDGTATAVEFGSTTVGSPVSLVFTIDNTAGGAALGVASLTLAGNPLPTAGYSNPDGFPSSVASGSTATFTIQLDATATGVFGGTLQFTTTDCDENPFSFPITGTVTGVPEIAVYLGGTLVPDGSVVPVDFGTTSGGHPVVLTFTIDNTAGTAELSLANLTLDGSPFPTGGFSNPGGFPGTVPAGGTATFDLQLDATAVGAFGGAVQFDTNDSDEDPYSFVIAGEVAEPIPAIAPAGTVFLAVACALLGLFAIVRRRGL